MRAWQHSLARLGPLERLNGALSYLNRLIYGVFLRSGVFDGLKRDNENRRLERLDKGVAAPLVCLDRTSRWPQLSNTASLTCCFLTASLTRLFPNSFFDQAVL